MNPNHNPSNGQFASKGSGGMGKSRKANPDPAKTQKEHVASVLKKSNLPHDFFSPPMPKSAKEQKALQAQRAQMVFDSMAAAKRK